MNFATKHKLFLLLLMLCFAAGDVLAQRVDGTLRGDVSDQSGAVVANARVTATNEATAQSQTIETTSAGTYVFPNLLVGSYTVSIEKSGFQKLVNKNVQVRSNQVTQANARLSVGGAETVVEVQAGADVVQTTDSTLANTVDATQLTSLPVQAQGGGVLNLAILAPNVTTQGGGVLGRGGSVGGARPRMNNFTVDGLDDNDVSVTGPITTVVPDAIAEFNLLTNQFSAEYGHSAGGQFNIVTKSGTNDYHGTAFIVNNNRNYNAFDNIEKSAQGCDTNPKNCEKARFDYNIIGGSVGGPIIKNKVFIFAAYQRQFAGFAGSSAIFETVTADGKSTLQNLASDSAVKEIVDQFPVAPTQTRTTTVNGQAIGVGDLSLLAPSYLNEQDWNINGDINVAKHQVRMRYIRNKLDQPNLSDPPIDTFSGSITQSVHKATFSDVWTLSDKVINDFRLGYSRLIQSYTVPDQFSNFPNVYVTELGSFQVGPEGNSPQSGGQNVYQLLDQVSLVAGPHTFKGGFEYRRWIAPSGFLPRSRGEWQYSNLGQLINDYVPSDFAKRGAGSGRFDGNQTGLFGFFQDDWKVTPKLTLNLGVRYEWFGIPNGDKLQALNSISDLPGTPLVFGIPKTDKNNFMPRIGFAYDPTGYGKWAVRGGYGISYDVIPQNFPTLSLPPQLQSEQDPFISCGLSNAPSWCAGFDPTVYNAGGNTGQGFLANGGLLQVNVPPTTQADARAGTQGLITNQIMPKVMTWTLSVQHELFSNTSVELRYLGTRSTQLPIQAQVNSRSAFDNGATPLPTYLSASDVPTSFAAGTPTLADFQSFIARPYAADGFLGSVTSFPAVGRGIYHAGSADFIHRMSRGVYLRANYTYAHNIDNSTNELFSSLINPRRPMDANHIGLDRGRSVLDIRHKLALSWVWQMPKFASDNLFAKILLNGWEYNGAYLVQTGQPATPRSGGGIDTNGNGDSAGDRAVLNPSGNPHMGSAADSVCWDGSVVSIAADCADVSQTVGYVASDPSAGFIQARQGTLSTAGRNMLTTPGRNNWDMALFKDTHITEGKTLQFRAEVFNVFNHRQFSFANPGVYPITGIDDSAINAAGYVDVTSTLFMDPKQLNGGSRQIQLGLKFIF